MDIMIILQTIYYECPDFLTEPSLIALNFGGGTGGIGVWRSNRALPERSLMPAQKKADLSTGLMSFRRGCLKGRAHIARQPSSRNC
jgi:hypothetical protein